MDLALNNLQRLIYLKTQPTNLPIYLFLFHSGGIVGQRRLLPNQLSLTYKL